MESKVDIYKKKLGNYAGYHVPVLLFPTAVDDVLAVDGSKNCVLCVVLCCGVLHYIVLCGRLKIRGHHYTCAAGLSAKRG